MLQELVLALAGHPGDLFEEDRRTEPGLRPPQPCPLRCRKAVGRLLAPPEVALVSQLARLGFHYRELAAFAQRHGLPQDPAAPAGAGSLYRRAFAAGLGKVLGGYQAALLRMEREVRELGAADVVLPLSALSQEMWDYHHLLPALHAIVWEVSRAGLRGGALLSFVHAKLQTGVPFLRAGLREMARHCNRVLLKQLAAWMVHGLLLDRHGEFFVVARDGGGGAGDWHGYEVARGSLPSFVRPEMAERVLFVGKAVQVLRRPSPPLAARVPPDQADFLPSEDADAIAGMLQGLQRAEAFDRLAFESCVEATQKLVAQRLWTLLAVHAELLGHLRALKDYYLLAKGDFYHAFLLEANDLLAGEPRESTAASSVGSAQHQAALKSNADGDNRFRHVALRFRRAAPAGAKTFAGRQIHLPAYDSWDDLALEYTVEGPLGLLLTPAVLDQYNCLFQYLFRLRRVQHDLDVVWQRLRKYRQGAPGLSPSWWQLRHKMAHMINNLQIYIQADVIEPQFERLRERVEVAQDFKEAERLHQVYLTSLVAQSFLDVSTIAGMLQGIMQLCRRFRFMVERGSVDPVGFSQVESEFNLKSKTLYTVLKSDKLAGSERAPFLRQFLLRLNFNNFVDNTITQALQQEAARQQQQQQQQRARGVE